MKKRHEGWRIRKRRVSTRFLIPIGLESFGVVIDPQSESRLRRERAPLFRKREEGSSLVVFDHDAPKRVAIERQRDEIAIRAVLEDIIRG